MSASPENKDELMPLRRSTRKSVASKADEQVLTPKKRKSTATPLKNAPESTSETGTPRKTRSATTPRKSIADQIPLTPRRSTANAHNNDTPKKTESRTPRKSSVIENSPAPSKETKRTPRKSLRSLKNINETDDKTEHIQPTGEISVTSRGRRKSIAATSTKKVNLSPVDSLKDTDSGIVSLDEDSQSLTDEVKQSPKRKTRKSVHFKKEVAEHQLETVSEQSSSPSPEKNKSSAVSSPDNSNALRKSCLALSPKVILSDMNVLKEAKPAESAIEGNSNPDSSASLKAETPNESSLDNVLPEDFLKSDESDNEADDSNTQKDKPHVKGKNETLNSNNDNNLIGEEYKSSPCRKLTYESVNNFEVADIGQKITDSREAKSSTVQDANSSPNKLSPGGEQKISDEESESSSPSSSKRLEKVKSPDSNCLTSLNIKIDSMNSTLQKERESLTNSTIPLLNESFEKSVESQVSSSDVNKQIEECGENITITPKPANEEGTVENFRNNSFSVSSTDDITGSSSCSPHKQESVVSQSEEHIEENKIEKFQIIDSVLLESKNKLASDENSVVHNVNLAVSDSGGEIPFKSQSELSELNMNRETVLQKSEAAYHPSRADGKNETEFETSQVISTDSLINPTSENSDCHGSSLPEDNLHKNRNDNISVPEITSIQCDLDSSKLVDKDDERIENISTSEVSVIEFHSDSEKTEIKKVNISVSASEDTSVQATGVSSKSTDIDDEKNISLSRESIGNVNGNNSVTSNQPNIDNSKLINEDVDNSSGSTCETDLVISKIKNDEKANSNVHVPEVMPIRSDHDSVIFVNEGYKTVSTSQISESDVNVSDVEEDAKDVLNVCKSSPEVAVMKENLESSKSVIEDAENITSSEVLELNKSETNFDISKAEEEVSETLATSVAISKPVNFEQSNPANDEQIRNIVLSEENITVSSSAKIALVSSESDTKDHNKNIENISGSEECLTDVVEDTSIKSNLNSSTIASVNDDHQCISISEGSISENQNDQDILKTVEESSEDKQSISISETESVQHVLDCSTLASTSDEHAENISASEVSLDHCVSETVKETDEQINNSSPSSEAVSVHSNLESSKFVCEDNEHTEEMSPPEVSLDHCVSETVKETDMQINNSSPSSEAVSVQSDLESSKLVCEDNEHTEEMSASEVSLDHCVSKTVKETDEQINNSLPSSEAVSVHSDLGSSKLVCEDNEHTEEISASEVPVSEYHLDPSGTEQENNEHIIHSAPSRATTIQSRHESSTLVSENDGNIEDIPVSETPISPCQTDLDSSKSRGNENKNVIIPVEEVIPVQVDRGLKLVNKNEDQNISDISTSEAEAPASESEGEKENNSARFSSSELETSSSLRQINLDSSKGEVNKNINVTNPTQEITPVLVDLGPELDNKNIVDITTSESEASLSESETQRESNSTTVTSSEDTCEPDVLSSKVVSKNLNKCSKNTSLIEEKHKIKDKATAENNSESKKNKRSLLGKRSPGTKMDHNAKRSKTIGSKKKLVTKEIGNQNSAEETSDESVNIEDFFDLEASESVLHESSSSAEQLTCSSSDSSVTSAFNLDYTEGKDHAVTPCMRTIDELFNNSALSSGDEDDSDWFPPQKIAKIVTSKNTDNEPLKENDLRLKLIKKRKLPLRKFKKSSSMLPTKQGVFVVSTDEKLFSEQEMKYRPSGFTVTVSQDLAETKNYCPKGFVITEDKSVQSKSQKASNQTKRPEIGANDKTSICDKEPSQFCGLAVLPNRLKESEIIQAFCDCGIKDIVSVKYKSSTTALIEFSSKKSYKRALNLYGRIMYNGKQIYVLETRSFH